MTYTFSAIGLPPGLSIVGNTVAGTPSTPGNYSVTFTVSDGVSSVSETASVSIGVVPVPLPFWQLLVEVDDVSYHRESANVQRAATVDDVSYWLESVFLSPGIGDDVITSTGDRVVTSTGDRILPE